jgi:hypothetical protein
MADSIDEFGAKLVTGGMAAPPKEPHELIREAIKKAPSTQKVNEIQRAWDGLVGGIEHMASLGVKLVLKPFEGESEPVQEYPKMIKLNDSGSKHIIVYSREEEEAELEKIVGGHSMAEKVEESEPPMPGKPVTSKK